MVNDWDKYLHSDPENEDRDGEYLNDVWNMASQYSNDPSTQVASALVTWSGGIVLAGWNEVPPEIRRVGYPKSIETKNFCTEHAERRVLYKAAKNRLKTDGIQLYSTWAACAECSRAIIQFGIKRVVTFRGLVCRTPPRWESSVKEGLQMMVDAGIQVVGWNGSISSSRSIRFDGELLDKTVVR